MTVLFTVILHYFHNFKKKWRKEGQEEKGKREERVEIKDFYVSYNYMQFGFYDEYLLLL